jgi:hypothetical protein
MDRKYFLRSAPAYYGLAIVAYLRMNRGSFAYKGAIQQFYHQEETEYYPEESYLALDPLFVAGAENAIELGLLEVLKDDFGPDLYRLAEDSESIWYEVTHANDGPYAKYAAAGDGAQSWLLSALSSISTKYSELEISNTDFDSTETEWQPIPLDRSDERLSQAIEKIDSVIEDIRGNNGYGSASSEERSYVFDKLRSVSAKLKQDSYISWIYLREFAIEPLSIVVRRFGKPSAGLLAEAAREALRAWLKAKGIHFLDNIF